MYLESSTLYVCVLFRFVSPDQKKKEGVKRDNEVLIQRKRNDVTIPYRVIDNPAKLQLHDW